MTTTTRWSAELLDFLDGETAPVVARLDRLMQVAAGDLEFERAARLRDQLASVRKAIERQQMVAPREEDLDVIGLAEDPIEASVQISFVRRGRVVGRKGLVVDKVEDVDTGELVGKIVEQLYGAAPQQNELSRERGMSTSSHPIAASTCRGGS